ncbi:MAG: FtsL-like putative cell division protein [Flavobacteriales bacterium]|nr:FtsL-like putative cell division protein [Flavobacteriales bacterium]
MKNTLADPFQAENNAEENSAVPQKRKAGIGRYINRAFNGEFLAREGLTNHLPFIAFLVGLFLLHITLIYYFENTEREIVRTLRQTEELRTRYISISSELHVKGLESKVAPGVEAMGLNALVDPPNIIAVEEGFFDEKK